MSVSEPSSMLKQQQLSFLFGISALSPPPKKREEDRVPFSFASWKNRKKQEEEEEEEEKEEEEEAEMKAQNSFPNVFLPGLSMAVLCMRDSASKQHGTKKKCQACLACLAGISSVTSPWANSSYLEEATTNLM